MSFRSLFFSAASVCALLSSAFGQTLSTAWVQHESTVAAIGIDRPVQVLTYSDGSVYMVGVSDNRRTSDDWVVQKYDGANGTLIWEKRIDGAAHRSDRPRTAALDSMGNVVVTGTIATPGDATALDCYTAKFSAHDGTLLWERMEASPNGRAEQGVNVAIDADDNVFVAVISDVVFLTAKYRGSDGAILWERSRLARASTENSLGLLIDAQGDVIMAGSTDVGGNSSDLFVVKYAGTDGAFRWQATYASTSSGGSTFVADVFRAAALASNGDILVLSDTNVETHVIRYAGATGAQSWVSINRFSITPSPAAAELIVDADQNVFVAGTASNADTDADISLLKLRGTDGVKVWQRDYNGAANQADAGKLLRRSVAGNPILIGHSIEDISRDNDFFIAEVSRETGDIVWQSGFAGEGTSPDMAVAAALDSAGNVVVAGSIVSKLGGNDTQLVKFAAADGAVVWEKSCQGQGFVDERVVAVTRDAAGAVIVTGFSGTGVASDWLTVKYARTGEVLWKARFDGGAFSEDRPTGVTVDFAGNVLVTGTINASRMMVIKYSPDGEVLWQRSDVGPVTANAPALGGKILTDGSGDVVVTGVAFGAQSDWFTAKLAGEDGELRWLSRYDGPDHRSDRPVALALDADGNAVVAGYSSKPTGKVGVIIKYLGMDGSTAWEKRPDGLGYVVDEWNDVAIDSMGNVAATGSAHGDIYTANYAATNGALRWGTLTGASYGNDAGLAITIDAADNVVVAGYTIAVSGKEVGHLSKYFRSNGAVLWARPLRIETKKAFAVETDASGNYVVGSSAFRFETAFREGFHLAKHAPTNGAVIEERFFDTQAGLDDLPAESPACLAIAADGSVAMAGGTVRGANFAEADFTTALFANLGPVVTLIGNHPLTLEAAESYQDAGATADDVEDGAIAPVVIENTVNPQVPGTYAVTWLATDSLGISGSATRSVMVVDTTAPTIAGPADVFLQTVDVTGAMVTYTAQATDVVGVESVISSHPSGSLFPLGVTTVVITATDAASNQSEHTFTVTVALAAPVHQIVASSDSEVIGAGVDSRVPEGASWMTIGMPTLSDSGDVAFAGKWKAGNPATRGAGIFRNDELLHATKEAAPVGFFKTFADPLFGRGSETLLGRVRLSGDVSRKADEALFALDPAVAAVWQKGAAWPGTEGVSIASIDAYSARGTQILAAARLQGRGVIASNNRAVFLAENGIITPVIRTGQQMLGKDLRSFRMLRPVPSSTGHGRGELHAGFVRFIAHFTDKSEAIVEWTASGEFVARASAAELTQAPETPNARWKSFGLAVSSSDNDEDFAFVANLQPGVGEALGRKPRAIVRAKGSAVHVIAETENDVPGWIGAKFATVGDPVLALDGSCIAFAGKAKVEGKLVPVIVSEEGNAGLKVVAALVDQPPGAPAGALWKSFSSLAAPGGGLGPLFAASLRVGPGGVTASNDQGIWALDSAGVLRCVAKEGDPVSSKTLASFTILKALAATPGATREFNSNRQIVWQAKFTDGSTGIVQTWIP